MAIADLAMRAKARGFTLIELMVAIAILALLMLLGMPSFITFLRNSEIRSNAESLINGLRTASAEATRQNAKVVFTLTGGAGWKINLVTDQDCAVLVAPPIQQYASTEAGKSTKITTTPGDKSTVCFNGLGRILNQGTAGDASPADRYRIPRRRRSALAAHHRRRRGRRRPHQTTRAPDVRPGPRAQVAGSSRPEGLLR